jgi:hypothetical protein
MTELPPLRWQAFARPKRGNSAADYEDAHAANPRSGRFAVADGATESSFAGIWATALTEGYVQAPAGQTGRGWLAPVRRRWAAQVDPLELPWYAEDKREQGAFATFVGLALSPADSSGTGEWRALAVGDACLFHVRGEKLISAFPIRNADDFDNRPSLIGSREKSDGAAGLSARRAKGRWRSGDQFFLATDALSEWFLKRHGDGRKPWGTLNRRLGGPSPDEKLGEWLEEQRDAQAMRNDDVTLLVISCP